MATKKRESVAAKKTRLANVQVLLTAFGRRIVDVRHLYVTGPLKERRPTRKNMESPVSTNPPTEYCQADYRNADGLKIDGPGSANGAAVFKALVGIRASINKAGKPVAADKRMDTLLSMLFARLLPTGVSMMSAYGAKALPAELLAAECERRFGPQAGVVFDYIQAAIALTAATTELSQKVKAKDKSGPVILED